jgi:serine phosphatase RsbU (regulator of sigma subunit)
VELAVTEAITNAIRHGCAGSADGVVRVAWSWIGETIEVHVVDPSSFSPQTVVNSSSNGSTSRAGHGLFLISSVMDHVEHRRTTGGHELVLRKKVGPAAMALPTSVQQDQRSAHQRALRELEIAATIQTSLQPRGFPENSNYRVFGLSRSALQVGGDYFDVLPVRNVGALLVIADVMGKGVPAALLATIFRTAVHCRLDLATRPGLLLRAVNQQINSDLYNLDMFITAQVAYLCYETHRMFLAHAGHCPLLRIPGGVAGQPPGPVERHGAQGFPLGIGGDVRFKESTISVQPGDRFVFLTDGLYELEDAKGEMLGLDRLAEECARLWRGTPEHFCAELFDFLGAYSQGASASDDRTVLTVQRQSA